MKRLRRDREPWYEPPPPPVAAIVRCRGCQAVLTPKLIRLTDPTALGQMAEASLVPARRYWVAPAGDDFGGHFVIALADLVGVGFHPDRGTGCCGPSGDDGPNRICVCGREVGTERSDCIWPHAVYLDPTQVELTDTGPAFDPAWRTVDVLSLARGIVADRAWDRLPILADALIEAGCDDETILNHCDQPEAAAESPWLVELILDHDVPR